MMSSPAMRRLFARSILGFLMRSRDLQGAAVVSLAALGLLGSGCGGSLTKSDAGADTGGPNCANVGCAAPPMCSTGCQAPCGCCSCASGQRNGDLLCTGGCYVPAPDGGSDGGGSVCTLPFDPGPCRAAIQVYAFVDGACTQKVYGGCEGNDNRFQTLEECLGTCAGPPAPGSCPPNRIAKEVCLGCGLAGGCSKSATICALVCNADAGAAACADSLPICYDGVCQYAFCI
jgi:hypothetical protein